MGTNDIQTSVALSRSLSRSLTTSTHTNVTLFTPFELHTSTYRKVFGGPREVHFKDISSVNLFLTSKSAPG